MNLLTSITKDVFNLIFPSLCEACDAELVGNENIICVSCWLAMPKTKFHLQKNNPIEQRFLGRVSVQFASAMYYFNKDTRMQEVLHALKYKGRKNVGIELGHRFGNEIRDCKWLNEIDIIIPIPLSKQKMKQRGFNQSECIAEGLSSSLSIPIERNSVIRRRNTLSQTTMTIAQRINNVKDAFEVINPAQLENKYILLLDDVLTTGATMESCAIEILKIPNTKIGILTLAYAIV